MDIALTLEIAMLLCFGSSWPFNVIKSYKARTAKGKSPTFLILIIIGYIVGISSKFASAEFMAHFGEKCYVLFFYALNLIMVSADLVLYVRNKKLDKKAELTK